MSLESLTQRYGPKLGLQKYEEFTKAMSAVTSGQKNPMYGKNYQSHGLRKESEKRKGKTDAEYYGPEKAKEISKKKSEAVLGKNNPMYGKPAPMLSGKGIKGYYKGHYFRSLLELLCMKHLEDEGIHLKDVDYENFVIHYVSYDGNHRTYRPDFFIPSRNQLIEIKPSKLISTPLNSLKFEAALSFCKERNIEFRILTEKSFTLSKEDAVKDQNVILLETTHEK